MDLHVNFPVEATNDHNIPTVAFEFNFSSTSPQDESIMVSTHPGLNSGPLFFVFFYSFGKGCRFALQVYFHDQNVGADPNRQG